MSILPLYLSSKPLGNIASSYVFTSGNGTFTSPKSGTLNIECWAKGGTGAFGNSGNGGGGGGGGGYSKKTLTVSAGDTFNYTINNSLSRVTSTTHSLTMIANTGSSSVLQSGGSGGTASGGDTNYGGRRGQNASGNNGGKGGNAYTTVGGAGGTSGVNGTVGESPGAGGGGGGGGSGTTLGGSGGNALIQFEFI